MLLPDMTDCGAGDTCRCASYRFQCTENDTACSKTEISSKAMKQAYIFTSKSNCEMMQHEGVHYSDVVCCSKDKCNKPAKVECHEM